MVCGSGASDSGTAQLDWVRKQTRFEHFDGIAPNRVISSFDYILKRRCEQFVRRLVGRLVGVHTATQKSLASASGIEAFVRAHVWVARFIAGDAVRDQQHSWDATSEKLHEIPPRQPCGRLDDSGRTVRVACDSG